MNRLLNPPVVAAVLLLLLAGAASLGWLWLRDGRIAPMGIVCALLPFGLLLWAILAGEGGRSQIGITAWALTMFGAFIPAIYVMRSGPENWFVQWRFLLTFGGAYLAIMIVFMLWLAAWTAWVPPAPGAMPLAEHRLKQRVRSLANAGLELRIETPAGRPDRLLVSREFRDGKRTIGMRLTFVSERHCVLAREVSLIRGDKPMDASEARMSSSLRPRDGTHPDADLIYDASLTVTPPSEAIRRQIALRIADGRVEIAGDKDAASAPANLAHVLTELVHQSGWGWQGVFADWQRACRKA
ncbi:MULTISPECIES: hypothetical protein [Sphingopyxis]|uniref:Uncharacterized protein n=1 Tax=Sphingopyxis panaciterrulae TaxID=462372 RepID=A0A7W9B8Y3_9SPHN|nr:MULTISPECIES: hypothetical protein [Sphingopyxis]MBB5708443.1 hypothetical protein [Sphingopyxis panaciterrulae]MCW0197639.1 hypothetical protein [Sphingopyxis sp.]